MGFRNRFRNLFRREDKTTPARSAAPAEQLTPRRGGILQLPSSGTALNVATVYRCVDLLAGSVSNLPVQYMFRKNGIFVDDFDSRLYYLLNVQPCPYLSAVDFWRMVVQYLLLRGNAYIVPVYDIVAMDISQLALVDPSCVMHDTVNDVYQIVDINAGITGTYTEDEIIHIKNFTRDGKRGISTVSFARTTTDIALAGDRETLNRFESGGNVRGIVSNSDDGVKGFGEYQDNELQKTAESLDERFRAGERILSLPGQAKFSPISLPSTDMQFLESRKFTVREICRWFAVHPSFVFDDTSNNYKSAEMANVAFLSTTLNPILRKIEAELQRKLIPMRSTGKRKIQYDRREVYACDLNSRIKYQAATIAAGIYTVNEWRAIENRPAVEGGDAVLVSANLKGITKTSVVQPVNEEPKKEKDDDDEKDE